MTLRRRLALTLFLTAAPLLLSFAWIRGQWQRRAEIDALRELVATTLALAAHPRDQLGPPPLAARRS